MFVKCINIYICFLVVEKNKKEMKMFDWCDVAFARKKDKKQFKSGLVTEHPELKDHQNDINELEKDKKGKK